MNLLQWLKSIVTRMLDDSDDIFSTPVGVQKAFLASLPGPTDDIQRSFLQYKCQMRVAGTLRRIVYQCAAAVLLLIPRPMRPYASCEPADAVYAFIAGTDVLPESLRREFANLVHRQDYLSHFLLTAADRQFLRQLRSRYPFAFYFRYKCLLKIGMYRAILEAYHPKALIVSGEYSFTSSVLTTFCEREHVEHINVMHGEKLFDIRDSFFRFHRCYVWDEHYIRLFEKLRAAEDQFLIEKPDSLKLWETRGMKKQVDCTYYLGGESAEVLLRIAGFLRSLQNQGFTVAVRLHPRYSVQPMVQKIFDGLPLEYPAEEDIQTSILRTKHVISLYSTVLLQAQENMVPIIIDDVSSPERYHQLQNMDYIILHKPHTLLSEHLKERNIPDEHTT